MDLFLAIATDNLLSAPVLFFILGFAATFAGAHLAMPEGAAKMVGVYLMLAIGFKGGVSLAAHPFEWTLIWVIVAGVALSALIPLLGFFLLGRLTALNTAERAAIAAHYGSISIVTFVAASSALTQLGIKYEGYMVAVAAAMETPAIITALILYYRYKSNTQVSAKTAPKPFNRAALNEVFLNATIVILLGAFAIGMITGEKGGAELAPFVSAPFKGVLCLFLLEMGAIAAKGARLGMRDMTKGLIGFAILMPLIGATLGTVIAAVIGLSTGSTALLITLAASASYIAVPAAMRLAIPEARPSIYLTLSLGVTFPFNLMIGIPLYVSVAQAIVGA